MKGITVLKEFSLGDYKREEQEIQMVEFQRK